MLSDNSQLIRYIDLFCGIGGFRVATEQLFQERNISGECVFSSDIDPHAQTAYEANFSERPVGDIRMVDAHSIPDHDLLFAGFPCQPFSIIGDGRGFQDSTKGTLFFEIARILKAKRPKGFLLENVKRLVGHDKGRTLKIILKTLRELGYTVEFKVCNALDFGLPQKRERVFIIGFLGPMFFPWPEGRIPMKPLEEILESDVSEKFYASEYIRAKRKEAHTSKFPVSIWHENKAGNISSYPFSCALRAGASYNYLLVNGERRLTSREMLRLQGFPDSYKIVCNYSQTRKQAGNAVAIPVVKAILSNFLPILQETQERHSLFCEPRPEYTVEEAINV